MSDEPNGRFDFIVTGGRHGRDPEWAGWKMEVLSVDHGRVTKIWDSEVSAAELEFQVTSTGDIDVRHNGHDYDLVMEGCTPHQCGDGIDGFLVFTGYTRKTYKAKVVALAPYKPFTAEQKYDVTFSAGITDDSKATLEDEICSSSAISNKPGLPFKCPNP
ncbi:MAG: hypothetical protein ACLP1Y_06050 [Candidatus Acidiferrales bacterium]